MDDFEIVKTKKEPCFICGKHQYICEQHHLNPQKNIKEDIELYGEYRSLLIWLCPNHHTYIHKLIYKYKHSLEECICIHEAFKNEQEMNQYIKLLKLWVRNGGQYE